MELAATAFSSLFPAGATTAPAATAASGALSALQTAATVTSMVSTLVGGIAGYQSHQSQARFAGINAEAERLEAESKSLAIRRELVKRIGDSRVAFAGAGLDISSGAEIEGALRSDAEFQIGMAEAGGRVGAAAGEATAASYRARGMGSLIGAAGDMARYGLGQALDLRKRG